MNTTNNTNEIQQELARIDKELNKSFMPRALAFLFQEPYQYLKNYAEITDSIPAGWFLSWFTALCEPHEEMELSNDDICQSLCFTKSQWVKVRNLLIKQDILKYRVDNKQTFFSLNDDKVEWLLRHNPSNKETDAINVFFPFILNVNRLHCASLIDLGVGLNAVILLAYLIDTLPAKSLNEREIISEPLLIHYDNISKETYLTKRQISNALTELNNIGVTNTHINKEDKQKYSTIYFNILADITKIYMQKKNNEKDITMGNDNNEQAT